MTTAKRWIVRASGFPFATPGDPIGTVTADDRDIARRLAAEVYGPKVVVEPETDTIAADPFPYRNVLRDQAAALAHAPRALRAMTVMEVQMARAVGVLRVGTIGKRYRGTVKRLHAETFKPQPQISDDLSKLLVSIVHATAKDLPRELVESVGMSPLEPLTDVGATELHAPIVPAGQEEMVGTLGYRVTARTNNGTGSKQRKNAPRYNVCSRS